METIGDRIREIRGELSQKAAAISTGIRQQVWNRYEKNQTSPASDSIIKICNTFKCSADWLLGLSDDPNGKPQVVNAANNSEAIAIGGGNAVNRDCMECPLLQAHLKKFSTGQKRGVK